MQNIPIAYPLLAMVLIPVALFLYSRIRGRPLVFHNRWIAVPNLVFWLFFLWIDHSEEHWEGWGISQDQGMLIGFAGITLLAFLVARMFPLRWGGIFILGAEKSDLRFVLRQAVRLVDPSAKFRADQWDLPSYAATVKTVFGFGSMNSTLQFNGKGAEALISDLLPVLQSDFYEFEVVSHAEIGAKIWRLTRYVLLFLSIMFGFYLVMRLSYR